MNITNLTNIDIKFSYNNIKRDTSMKRLFSLIVFSINFIAIWAHDFEVDGIYYNITSSSKKTVEVTYKGSSFATFSDEYIGDITIPSTISFGGQDFSVTSIGKEAFRFCIEVTSVTISNGLTEIGESAFCDCIKLSSINIPNSVTDIKREAFKGSGIISIEISSGVKGINTGVFMNCQRLTSVILPNGLTRIDSYAFNKCSSLLSISIPITVRKIDMCAFSSCVKLTNIIIPKGVEVIPLQCFDGCVSLVNVIIPEGVTQIRNRAFADCCSLTSINLPNGITHIGDEVFNGTNLVSIIIPEGVASLGHGAFYNCYNLREITFPKTFRYLDITDDFSGCKFEIIKVTEGNPWYDSRDNCNAVIETSSNTLVLGSSSTIIPNSVTNIGKYAFQGCKLTSITIPKSVVNIGVDAFWGCPLNTIYSYIPAERLYRIGSNTFYGSYDDAQLYVPYGSKSTYQSTRYWNLFEEIIEMEQEPSFSLSIGTTGYASLYLDETVEIPEGIEVYIANKINGDRVLLKEVTRFIPANTGVIVKAQAGNYVFNYTDVIVPAIQDNLFKGTTTDTYITLSKNMSAYVLSDIGGDVGMYRVKLTDGKFLNNANKVYLELPEIGVNDDELDSSDPGAQLSNGFRFVFPGTTDIRDVETHNLQTDIYYDLQGRKVVHPTRGMYILNGKKVFIK